MPRTDWILPFAVLMMILLPILVVVSLLIPQSAPTRGLVDAQTQILCGSLEQTLDVQTYSMETGGIAFNVSCVDALGQRNDATWQLTLLIFASVCSPIVLGVILASMFGQLSIETQDADTPQPNTINKRSKPTLSDQLQEVEDAYQKRLIDREEYHTARQHILDKWGG